MPSLKMSQNRIKCYDYAVVFQEIPDEITLALEISNCPHKCPECHSAWLREDIGVVLDEWTLLSLIEQNKNITCVCFMGGDANHDDIIELCKIIHDKTDKKTAMYSGDDELDPRLIEVLDYYKIGSYQKDKGPLSSPTTNQILYYIFNKELKDITYKFQLK